MFGNGYGNDQKGHTHSIPSGSTGVSIPVGGNHNHNLDGVTGTIGNNEEFSILPHFQAFNYIIYAN